jgi:hypothetical protein
MQTTQGSPVDLDEDGLYFIQVGTIFMLTGADTLTVL